MRYYIIHNNQVLIAENINTLSKYYDEEIKELPEDYSDGKYIIVDNKLVLNPDWEEEQKEYERERINLLSLTGADVERAIYKDKGIDFDDILEMVKDIPSIDEKALKIEFKANNFYRGNPYVISIGELLGYSSEDLDYLFENKVLPTHEEETKF